MNTYTRVKAAFNPSSICLRNVFVQGPLSAVFSQDELPILCSKYSLHTVCVIITSLDLTAFQWSRAMRCAKNYLLLNIKPGVGYKL
jgi:hypothetical protein